MKGATERKEDLLRGKKEEERRKESMSKPDREQITNYMHLTRLNLLGLLLL